MDYTGFKVESGAYGKLLRVTSQWSETIEKYIFENQIKELTLNYALGWKGDSILFLEKIGSLIEKFIILDWNIKDIHPIHFLVNLKHLQISTSYDTIINFTVFQQLEDYRVDWTKKSESLFELHKLKYLYLGKYLKTDIQLFRNFSNLETLILANSSKLESLSGIEKLKNLKNLSIYNSKKLTSIDNIKELENLATLEIGGCKNIKSIKVISELLTLKRLSISNIGKIDSLKFIEKLKNLEELFFIENTEIIDGDLAPIKQLKKLKRLGFQKRRHYSHSEEELLNSN